MYLMGIEIEDGRAVQSGAEPCRLCKRVIINAGLEKVVTRNASGYIIVSLVKDWISDEDLEYGIDPLLHRAHKTP